MVRLTAAGWDRCCRPLPALRITSSSASADIRPDLDATWVSFAPPENSSVAPHSLVSIWAVSEHRIVPYGGVSAESAIELAAVPVDTGITQTSVPKRSEKVVLQRFALRVLAVGLRRTHVDASKRGHDFRRRRGDIVGVQVSKEQRRHRYGWDGKFCLKEVVEVQPVQVFKKETRRGAGSVEVARQCGGRRWPRVRNRTRQPAVGSAARPPDLSRNRNLPSVFPLQCPVAGSTMWRIVRNLWLLRAVWRWWRQRR